MSERCIANAAGQDAGTTKRDRLLFNKPLVSAEDLLLSKLVWAKDSQSELQLKDAQNLIDAKTDMDWTYLRRWAEDFVVTRMLNALTGVPQ